jgi:hypothetical protein
MRRQHRVVQQQHEQTALGVLRARVALHIRGHGPHPRGFRGLRVGNVDGGKRRDRLRLAVFEHREVLRGQPPHRRAVLVEHRHVEVHEIDRRS